jgi:hypothetical protein
VYQLRGHEVQFRRKGFDVGRIDGCKTWGFARKESVRLLKAARVSAALRKVTPYTDILGVNSA